MADLTNLKTIRAAFKGHCTKSEAIAEQIMSSEDSPDYEQLESILEAYSLRLEKITVMFFHHFSTLSLATLS